MAQVILKGSQQTQWQIGNRFLAGSVIHELTEDEITKHSDVIHTIFGRELPKGEPKVEIATSTKYTEESLIAMTKAQQVEILISLGIDKIPTTEKARVKAILEAQK